jgi:hypothetical protein
VVSGNPVGTLDQTGTGPGSITVAGWAIDPDTANPIQVHVYVDGRPAGATTASNARPDVGSLLPAYGPNHGYQATFTGYGAGNHSVCAYGINVLTGTSNTLLGCRTVTVPGGNPFGTLDVVSTGAGSITVAGWTIDPDTADPISVHVYIDGRPAGSTVASVPRTDVGRVYPAYGANHGYQATFTGYSSGRHTACAYGINVLTGTANVLLGCRDGTVP